MYLLQLSICKCKYKILSNFMKILANYTALSMSDIFVMALLTITVDPVVL